MNGQENMEPCRPGRPATPPDEEPAAGENIVAALLKAPRKVAEVIAKRECLMKHAGILLGCALAAHAVFGAAVGLFGGTPVAAMDAAKAPLVAVCSLLLCFPSLYVFACVGGTPLSLAQTVMLGCSCLAMLGLLLAGLAPVAWLFAVSTDSIPFVVTLCVLIWLVAATFAARYVGKLKAVPLFQRSGGIKLWFLIFALVTLQMATCMRPMLVKPEAGWWTGEKKFFVSHFASTFEARKAPPPRGPRRPR